MLLLSKNIGVYGEALACKYLQGKDYRVIERNFQNTKGYKYGEIDIIAMHNKTFVFVEVKTRLVKYGHVIIPEENISHKKLKNLEKIASTYIATKKLWGMQYRFDAISIVLDLHLKTAKVRHLENIFF